MHTNDYAFTTTGLMGVGKTWSRVRWGVHDLLKDPEGGTWYTNFPLRRDAIIELVAKRYKQDPEAVAKRVQLIPHEVIEQWRAGVSGPWDYFDVDADGVVHELRGRPLNGAHIAIDEAHEIVGKGQRTDAIFKWQQWISWIRHYGGRIEFVTQSRTDIHKDILNRVGTRLHIINLENERVAWFGYLHYDLFQLASKFMGFYTGYIEERLARNLDGKEQKEIVGTHWRDPEIYALYDSYNTRNGGSAKREKMPWERYSWPRLLLWFLARNPVRVLKHVGFPVLLIVAYFNLSTITQGGLAYFKSAYDSRRGEPDAGEVQERPIGVAPADRLDRAIELVKRDVELSAGAEEVLRKNYRMLQLADEKIREVLQENEELDGRLDELRKQVEASFSVSMIEPEAVTFRGGYRYQVGEVIDFGPYEERTIERIDWPRRAAYLDNGRVLRLGFVAGVSGPEGEEAEATGSGPVSGELRAIAAASGATVGDGSAGNIGDNVGLGNADGRFRQTSDQLGGRVDRDGTSR